jgi:hypothetical protein
MSKHGYNCINSIGIDYQSFLLLKIGIKPAIRIGVSDEGALKRGMAEFCDKNNFFYIVKKFNCLFGQKLDTPIYNVYIAKSKENALLTYEYEKSGDRLNFGKMLGYPECCIDAFIKNLKDGKDFILLAKENTKSNFSYYCNNLFNYDSKLSSHNVKIYYDKLPILDRYNYCYLIRHMPCSYDCSKSIALGKKTLELMNDDNPAFANAVVNALKNVVLYFDYFNWVVLKGRIINGAVIYSEVLSYESLISKTIIKKIKQGDRIIIIDKLMLIFKNNKNIFEIKNKSIGVILDFTK